MAVLGTILVKLRSLVIKLPLTILVKLWSLVVKQRSLLGDAPALNTLHTQLFSHSILCTLKRSPKSHGSPLLMLFISKTLNTKEITLEKSNSPRTMRFKCKCAFHSDWGVDPRPQQPVQVLLLLRLSWKGEHRQL